MTQYVFLSHDVDWRRQGPSIEHILARKERFEKSVLEQARVRNPYYNMPEIMALEEKFGVRSTFFFRTTYEDGDCADYADDIRALLAGGWEVGLHCDPSSVGDIERIRTEKETLERLTNKKVAANRVHYLKFDPGLPEKLLRLGFVYDSSTKKHRDSISLDDMHYYRIGRLIEFPITLMDAYMFTYIKVQESDIIATFDRMLETGRSSGRDFNVISVLWHDNVLKMKGGRMYPKILEHLASQDDVRIARGIDIAEMINR